MINEKFLNNWLKILNYNNKINESSEIDEITEKITIPFTPIDVNALLIYNFLKYLYPEIINDQQNVLDIIITNDKEKILDTILYETKEPGVPISYEKLNTNIIKSRKFSTENLEESFFNIQKRVLKKKELRISHIRIFKEEFIEILNKYLTKLDDLSFHEFFISLLEIIEKSIREKLLFISPKPNLLSFLEDFLQFFNHFHLTTIFELLFRNISKGNCVVIFYSRVFSFIVKLNMKSTKKVKNCIKIFNPRDLEIEFDKLEKHEILKKVNMKFKNNPTYLIEQGQILRILNELFEFEFPIQKEKLNLFLQKLLFQFRSFQSNWYRYPPPKTYRAFYRFFIRLFGFNYNLKKISHWAIPELLYKSDLIFGMNSKIVLILSNLNPEKEPKKNNNVVILLKTENNAITNIYYPSVNNLEEKNTKISIKTIRNELSTEYGYINIVIKIDKFLIDLIMQNFILKFTKFQIFSKLKTIRAIKDEKYLSMYPEIPIYKFIKKSNSLRIFKTILPILIDKHEF